MELVVVEELEVQACQLWHQRVRQVMVALVLLVESVVRLLCTAVEVVVLLLLDY
jgi:hypothetical protein